MFLAFQERYSRWSVEKYIRVFVTKGKRGNRNGYGKSVDEEKEKTESRKEKMQRISRGGEKKRRAEKAEKYKENNKKFQERYSRWRIAKYSRGFVTKEKRGKQKWVL